VPPRGAARALVGSAPARLTGAAQRARARPRVFDMLRSGHTTEQQQLTPQLNRTARQRRCLALR